MITAMQSLDLDPTAYFALSVIVLAGLWWLIARIRAARGVAAIPPDAAMFSTPVVASPPAPDDAQAMVAGMAVAYRELEARLTALDARLAVALVETPDTAPPCDAAVSTAPSRAVEAVPRENIEHLAAAGWEAARIADRWQMSRSEVELVLALHDARVVSVRE